MLRSDAVTKGIQRSPNRAMLRAVGFGDRDFGKPILGIANGYSTITPCNVGLNDLSKRAEEAARLAGGMPPAWRAASSARRAKSFRPTLQGVIVL